MDKRSNISNWCMDKGKHWNRDWMRIKSMDPLLAIPCTIRSPYVGSMLVQPLAHDLCLLGAVFRFESLSVVVESCPDGYQLVRVMADRSGRLRHGTEWIHGSHFVRAAVGSPQPGTTLVHRLQRRTSGQRSYNFLAVVIVWEPLGRLQYPQGLS